MLATASFDGSVRLWDVISGSCIRVLNRHRDSVYSVAFSPSGKYLASGSLAGQLYIWDVENGAHVRNYKGGGDIFEVAWNKEETRVAACFSSNAVCIIDFREPGKENEKKEVEPEKEKEKEEEKEPEKEKEKEKESEAVAEPQPEPEPSS